MGMQLRSCWQKNKRFFIIATIVIVLLFAFALAILRFGWDWTGFNGGVSKITMTSTSKGTTTAKELQPTRTLWDWLQLLIVPIILAVGGFWLNQIQKDRDWKAEEAQKQREEAAEEEQERRERENREDNQREAALKAYIDNVSELILQGN